MSKTFARSSLCALSMTIMTAHAAEPPTNLDKPEGRLDIIAWPGYIERGRQLLRRFHFTTGRRFCGRTHSRLATFQLFNVAPAFFWFWW